MKILEGVVDGRLQHLVKNRREGNDDNCLGGLIGNKLLNNKGEGDYELWFKILIVLEYMQIKRNLVI